jgi:sugar phosphate permease
MFAVTFLAMITRHACLSAWAISKTNVHDEEGFSKPELGYFDTSFLFFYAIGNFISGVLDDNFPLRYVTPTQIIFFGYGGAPNFAAFMVFWAISGIAQSAVLPGGVAVISNWYPKRTRGQVMGWWSSNSSVGDIVGQQIGGLMLGVMGLNWKAVMLVTSSLLGASAILFAFVVRDKPSKDLIEQDQADFSYRDMQEEEVTHTPEVPETQKKGISFWKAWLLPG